MNDITFYQRFQADILAGCKTITIRDKSESHFKTGDILLVGRFEDNQYFCTIEVLSVSLGSVRRTDRTARETGKYGGGRS